MLNGFHIVVANKCILEILWPNSDGARFQFND